MAKNLLKNKKAELRLTINDILNQNTGVSRTAGGNYVQDTRYTVLKRYVLLSFTYNLSKFGQMGAGMRGMGGGQRMMIMQ
jgi:hypothetical protein